MTVLDWIIVLFAALFAFVGYERGFLSAVFALAGFAVGVWIGTRIGPALLPGGSHSPYASLFALGGAIFAGILLASGFHSAGQRLRRLLRIPGLGILDGLLGALLAAGVAFGLAWIGGAVALHTPGFGELRRGVQSSAVLTRLNHWLPPSGPVLNVLARLDPLPRLPGRKEMIPAPSAKVARLPAVQEARGSVVRIYGTACGLGIQGSGWVAAPEVVVTNAHVVAGESDTTVQVSGVPPSLGAELVHFDPRNDLAVLRVTGLSLPALEMAANVAPKTSGAILGYPENGLYSVRAARVGTLETARSQDSYGRGPVLRKMVSLRGVVKSGNSGGPVVDRSGRVVATVFAALTGKGPPGGFGVPNSVVERALKNSDHRVDSGPCVSG